MESLRGEFDCSQLQQQISQLDDKLNIAVSENDRLQHSITQLEKWKEKLEKESESLLNIGPSRHILLSSSIL